MLAVDERDDERETCGSAAKEGPSASGRLFVRAKQESSLDPATEGHAFPESFFRPSLVVVAVPPSFSSSPSSSSSLSPPFSPHPPHTHDTMFARLAVPAALAALASVAHADAISTQGLSVLVPGGDSLWWGA